MTEPEPNLAICALKKAPWGVLILKENRIVWANESLARALQTSPDDLANATAESVGLKALFERESEQLILRIAEGESRYLRRHWQYLPELDVEAHFFDDVTEQLKLAKTCEQLRELVKVMENRDAETGFMNQKAILQALDEQISRSRRYGNPLSLIQLCLVPPPHQGISGIGLGNICQELKMQLRWADRLGRLNQGSLLLVLPETNQHHAGELINKLEHEPILLASRADGWVITFSAATWKKGDDARKLLNRLGYKPSDSSE